MTTGDSSLLGEACRGVVPLTGRLEPWHESVMGRPDLIAGWVEEHGSPVNLLEGSAMERNAAELRAAAAAHGIDLGIHFARKANKALTFVDEAIRLGLGLDLASEPELEQALDRGADPGVMVMTAAIKPASLLRRCVQAGVTVVVDNEDELHALAEVAAGIGSRAIVALRLAPSEASSPVPTRFGLDAAAALLLVDRRNLTDRSGPIELAGVHFHLDGYDAGDRVNAIAEALELIDGLRDLGCEPRFLDIGGGVPMSYLRSPKQWRRFWHELRLALHGGRSEITYGGHALGMHVEGDEVLGRARVYPFHQQPVRGEWLDGILRSPDPGGRGTIAEAVRSRGLELRCEPGRALLDGCGMTVARVEYRKRRADGTWLIGVAMNRTQCRSTSEDFLVDPLLVSRPRPWERSEPIEGYLVGAYCVESELLTWRKLSFPRGVGIGDLVIFPNTAGYLMHILESASHQIPLARNLVLDGQIATLDPIDAGLTYPVTSGVSSSLATSAATDSNTATAPASLSSASEKPPVRTATVSSPAR